VEHPAVLAAADQLKNKGWSVVFWPVDAMGLIRLEFMEELLDEPTRMVSLIAAQSEVGALQPTALVGRACRDRGITFHSDATQLIPQGCPEFNRLHSDLISLSAHKFQGPRGIGLLIRDSSHPLVPVQGGGGQEFGLRSGTEALALIAGMAQALSVLPTYHLSGDTIPPGSGPHVRRQRDDLLEALLDIPGLSLLGPNVTQRSPNHIAVLVGSAESQPIPARAMVRELARRGVACSSGSACRSGQRQDSSVLTAMNIPEPWRQSGLRFTLGPWLDDKTLMQVPDHVVAAQRALS
jgi:cysteine desulfurase